MYSKPPLKSEAIGFRTFEGLEVYQVAREFRKAMYGVTRRLPAHEKFELASQIRRAAVSVTNNIAEGHGRYHFLDQNKFTLQARGALQESIDELNICEDEAYLPASEVVELKQPAWRAHKLVNGYIRYLRVRKAGATSALRDAATADLTDDALDALPAAPVQRFDDSTIPRI